MPEDWRQRARIGSPDTDRVLYGTQAAAGPARRLQSHIPASVSESALQPTGLLQSMRRRNRLIPILHARTSIEMIMMFQNRRLRTRKGQPTARGSHDRTFL